MGTAQATRAEDTRNTWKDVLAKHHEDRSEPVSEQYWSEKDTWSRDRIREVQDEKIAAVAPFLYREQWVPPQSVSTGSGSRRRMSPTSTAWCATGRSSPRTR